MDSDFAPFDAAPVRIGGSGIAHAAFLERVRAEAEQPEGRLALAAFLTLRLLDHFLSDTWQQHLDPVFWYQHGAVTRHLEQLAVEFGPDDELNHLIGLVRAAGGAKRRATTAALAAALLGYSFYLEQHLHLHAALDVLQLTALLITARKVSSETVACALALGRTHRKLTNFDEAEAAYELARRLAEQVNDPHSAFLSRLGREGVRLRRGNLPETLRQLKSIRNDASAAGDIRAVALAEHDLGVALSTMGRMAEAIHHTFDAFNLYQDAERRLWALHDVGVMLKKLGDHEAAHNAFVVTRKARSTDVRANALIELMQIAAATHNRFAFAKWRKRCLELEPRLPPERSAFYMTVGSGLTQFGRRKEGRQWLDRALEAARDAGMMHELAFRIERTIEDLHDAPAETEPAQTSAEASPDWAATRDVAASLEELAHAKG